jgi:SLT domain-containing protein
VLAIAAVPLVAYGFVNTTSTGGGTPTGGPATPPQIQVWITEADQILQANGTPTSALDDSAVALIIQHESGGNPAAINRTDSNAAAGTPSIGLMQTIGPTFQRWAVPGHGDIRNPVDNIAAGVRYAIGRYKSLGNVPGVRSVRAGGPYRPY